MPANPLQLLQDAVMALRQGNIAAADRISAKLIQQVPREFHALQLRGVICARQGRFAEADRLMSAALAIRAEPEGLKNHAAVLIELGRHDEAIACLNRALLMKPGYAEAHFNLGNALRKSGRLNESVAAFAAALRHNPGYVEALQNQSDSLRDLDRQDEAIAALRRAIELRPKSAQLYNNLGIALRDVGEIDEARVMFERAVALDPDFVSAFYNLARTGKVSAPDILAAMESALTRIARQPANERARLHFALAKAFEDAGRYNEAFMHLREGNGLTRSLIRYDETIEAGKFARVMKTFDAELLAKAAAGDPSELPIFIVGFPRSGTTLTEQIITSHPAVHGGGELELVRGLAAGMASGKGENAGFPEGVVSLDSEGLRRLGASYLAHFQPLGPGIIRVTDKGLGNIALAGFIHLILPNARIIHVSRDPLDTCLSCFSLKFGENAVPFSYDLGELGRAYGRYRQMMRHWRKVLPAGVMLEVSYETMVDDLEPQARRLIEHCGLPWDDRCLSFHESERAVRTASVSQVRQPIYRSSLQRWRRYEKHLGPLLEALGPLASAAAPVSPGTP